MFSSYNPPIISSIYLQGLEISATDAKNAAVAAQTSAESARDEALAYRNETHDYYTQVQQVQTGDYVTSQSLADALGAFGFADLASVPEAFVPTEHMHSWSEITGKPNAFTPAYHTHSWAHITDKPAEYEPAEHTHSWQQIAQKPGTFPPESHYHNWADIEGKPNAFNPAAHTHSWLDISGKPTKFEPVAHSHGWDEIEGKPVSFPPASHSHHWDTVTNKPASATRWPTFNEVTGKPAHATRWPRFDEVTDKPTLGTAAARNVGENAGEVVTVGAFGVGVVTPPALESYKPSDVSNWKTGFVRIDDGTLDTAADFLGNNNVYGGGIALSHSGGNKSLFMCDSIDSEWYGFSYTGGGGWSKTVKFFHSGNCENPYDFGLGSFSSRTFSDWNQIPASYRGFLRIVYNAANTPAGIDPLKVYHGVYIGSNFSPMIKVWGGDENQQFEEYTVLVKLSGNAWEGAPTYVVKGRAFHSENANFDLFGGNDSGEEIAQGLAVTSSIARFKVHLSRVDSARGLEVFGTFGIYDAKTGGLLVDGINGLSIISRSSNKTAIIAFNGGASIFTEDADLELRTKSSGAYLKVS